MALLLAIFLVLLAFLNRLLSWWADRFIENNFPKGEIPKKQKANDP